MNDMEMKACNSLVSVLIPSYNHEKYVDACINSVLAQTYENVEIIIIDDSSKDENYNRILLRRDELEKRFRRVVIKRNSENRGVSRTLNIALAEAKGQYIKLLASDDMLLPNALKNMKEYLEKRPELSMVFSNAAIIEDNKTSAGLEEKPNLFYKKKPDFKPNLFERVYRGNCIAAPCAMFRGEVFKQLGGFDESIAIEDWEYMLRMAVNGCQIDYMNETLVLYRRSETSITNYQSSQNAERKFNSMMENELKILEKYAYVDRSLADEVIRDYCFMRFNLSSDNYFRDANRRIYHYMKTHDINPGLKRRIKYRLFQMGIWRKLR